MATITLYESSLNNNMDIILKCLFSGLIGMVIGVLIMFFGWNTLYTMAREGIEKEYIIYHPNTGEFIWNPELTIKTNENYN